MQVFYTYEVAIGGEFAASAEDAYLVAMAADDLTGEYPWEFTGYRKTWHGWARDPADAVRRTLKAERRALKAECAAQV
jgi:hypothetical protein